VQELHRRFADAIRSVLTCSRRESLRLATLAGRTVEVNRRAAELAREVVGGE
jgi:hypothetical protein